MLCTEKRLSSQYRYSGELRAAGDASTRHWRQARITGHMAGCELKYKLEYVQNLRSTSCAGPMRIFGG